MISKEDIFKAVCLRYSTTEVKLKGKSRQGDLDNARKILAILLKKYIKPTYRDVGIIMHRTQSSVFELIDDCHSRMEVDKVLANNFNSIEYALLHKNEKR